MTIPWTTALQVARKLLPVVIEKAPDLLKTFERFRAGPPAAESSSADPTLSALQEQIEAHQRTITLQADTIVDLRRTVSRTQGALTLARTLLAATIFLASAIIAYLLLRP
jgi:hypothetical protein